jgi:anaphase-promoting complex subunit 2
VHNFFSNQELVTGEPVLLDLNEESDNEDQDFDAWEPDPVDADPSKCCNERKEHNN